MKRKYTRQARLTLFTIGLLLLWSTAASAVTFTFTRVVDTSTFVPGGTGTFSSFEARSGLPGVGPSLKSGNIAFLASSQEGEGVYTVINGALNVVADSSTAIPPFVEPFVAFVSGALSFDGHNVSFLGLGGGEDLPWEGYYTDLGGSLRVVADLGTPVPGGAGTFVQFQGGPASSLDNGIVAFDASVASNSSCCSQGVYTETSGVLDAVVDVNTNTPVPGGTGNFANVFEPSLDNGDVAFWGYSADWQGIYVYEQSEDAVKLIADTDSQIPAGIGNFTSLNNRATLKSGEIAFQGFGSGSQQGIYVASNGAIEVVADTNTSIPGGSGNFIQLGLPHLLPHWMMVTWRLLARGLVVNSESI